MRKFLIFFALMLSGCATGNDDVITLISREQNTNIFVNDELVGVSYVQVTVPDEGIQNVTFKGVKEGCQTATIPAEYELDISPIVYISNPWNIENVINGNVFKKTSKRTYYVTPICH